MARSRRTPLKPMAGTQFRIPDPIKKTRFLMGQAWYRCFSREKCGQRKRLKKWTELKSKTDFLQGVIRRFSRVYYIPYFSHTSRLFNNEPFTLSAFFTGKTAISSLPH
jgi:hypothetical protein